MATPASTLPAGRAGATAVGRYYLRFDLLTRVMHALLMFTFIGCALTGLPLLVADHAWAQAFARMLGGFQVTMLIHRICAGIMIVAQMRWIRPAPWKPPISLTRPCAQVWSANSSGTPVSAQPMKVSIRNACITRSIGPNRR